MGKTPDEIKELIVSWLKETNVKYTIPELSDEQKKQLEFSINVPGIIPVNIYTLKKFPDRIILQSDIRFHSKSVEVLKSMDAKKRNGIIFNVTNALTSFNVRKRLLFNEEKILNGIRIHVFTHEPQLTKDWILNSDIRIKEVTISIMDILNVSVGPIGPNPEDTNDDDSLPYG